MNSNLNHIFGCIFISLFVISLLFIPANAITVDFQQKYNNWNNSEIIKESQLDISNPARYPYAFSENATHYIYERNDDRLVLQKNIVDVVRNYPTKISFEIQTTKATIVAKSIANGSGQRYIVIPESLKKARFLFDDVKPDVIIDNGITQWYADPSTYWYSRNGNLRFNFLTAPYASLNASDRITFVFNSFLIDNATTTGFTSGNVSLNGSRWSGYAGGSLGLHLKNDSQTNMSGLVGYWAFDETTGTLIRNVNTESGVINSTNRGTWNGNATLNYTVGKIGNASSFDGVNDYVDTGNDQSLNITNAITIEAWIKPNNLSGSQAIISKSKFGNNLGSYELALNGNRVRLLLSQTGAYASDFDYISTQSISNGVWTHVVGVYTGTNVILYANGVALTHGKLTFPTSIYSSTANNYIGARPEATPERFFNGAIDEVRIWNRALPAPEIAVRYNTSLRPQAMIEIWNQTAASGKVIYQVRVNHSLQNSLNNVSIYGRQNGTVAWSLIRTNATSATWYSITDKFNVMDFGIMMQGNGSNTTFVSSLEWDEILASAPMIISWGNNYTNNDSISITVPKYTTIEFNTTSDLVSENWHWTGVDSMSGNGTINSIGTKYFDTMGYHIVTTYGNNSVSNSNTITWIVNVLGECCFNLSGYIFNTLELPLENARIDFNGDYVFSTVDGYYLFSGINEGTTDTILARAIGYRNETNITAISVDTTMNFTLKEKTAGTVSAPGFQGILAIVGFILFWLYRKHKHV